MDRDARWCRADRQLPNAGIVERRGGRRAIFDRIENAVIVVVEVVGVGNTVAIAVAGKRDRARAGTAIAIGSDISERLDIVHALCHDEIERAVGLQRHGGAGGERDRRADRQRDLRARIGQVDDVRQGKRVAIGIGVVGQRVDIDHRAGHRRHRAIGGGHRSVVDAGHGAEGHGDGRAFIRSVGRRKGEVRDRAIIIRRRLKGDIAVRRDRDRANGIAARIGDGRRGAQRQRIRRSVAVRVDGGGSDGDRIAFQVGQVGEHVDRAGCRVLRHRNGIGGARGRIVDGHDIDAGRRGVGGKPGGISSGEGEAAHAAGRILAGVLVGHAGDQRVEISHGHGRGCTRRIGDREGARGRDISDVDLRAAHGDATQAGILGQVHGLAGDDDLLGCAIGHARGDDAQRRDIGFAKVGKRGIGIGNGHRAAILGEGGGRAGRAAVDAEDQLFIRGFAYRGVIHRDIVGIHGHRPGRIPGSDGEIENIPGVDRCAIREIGDLAIGIGERGRPATHPGKRECPCIDPKGSPPCRRDFDGVDDRIFARRRIEAELVAVVAPGGSEQPRDETPVFKNRRYARQVTGRTGPFEREIRPPCAAVPERPGDGRPVIARRRDAGEGAGIGGAVVTVKIDDRRVVDGGHGDARARRVRHQAIGIGCRDEDVANRALRVLAGVLVGDGANKGAQVGIGNGRGGAGRAGHGQGRAGGVVGDVHLAAADIQRAHGAIHRQVEGVAANGQKLVRAILPACDHNGKAGDIVFAKGGNRGIELGTRNEGTALGEGGGRTCAVPDDTEDDILVGGFGTTVGDIFDRDIVAGHTNRPARGIGRRGEMQHVAGHDDVAIVEIVDLAIRIGENGRRAAACPCNGIGAGFGGNGVLSADDDGIDDACRFSGRGEFDRKGVTRCGIVLGTGHDTAIIGKGIHHRGIPGRRRAGQRPSRYPCRAVADAS